MLEYLKVVDDKIAFNVDLFNRKFKPRSTNPLVVANTDYIKVVDGKIEVDVNALRRDFEPR